MDMQQVFTLMERFAASPLTGLEVALEGGRVKLEKSAGAGPASAAPASSAPLQAQLHAPAPAPELPGCEGTLRVDEDASNAQGFYIALLRKPGDSAAVPGLARGTAATAAYRAIPPAFLAEFGLSPALLPPGDLAVFEDSLHFLPAPALAHLPAAVRWQGMALGKASAQGLIPSARLRALLDPEPQRIPRLDVDDVPILERLLQGGSLDTGLPGKEASLFWRGLPLGRLRLKAGRAVWSDR